MRSTRARLLGSVAALWIVPASAQSSFPTPSGTNNAPGTVIMCPTGANAYVPCGAAGAMPLAVRVPTAAPAILGTPASAVVGSYCMGLASGIIAAGMTANSPIISFRYGGSNGIGVALVRSVTLSIGDTATAFTAGVSSFQLFAARSFSASDTTGNTATLTGNNGKMKTAFPATSVVDFRVAATGVLTAGTRTLDATPLGSISVSDVNTAGSVLLPGGVPILKTAAGEQPLQLSTNEGFVVQALAVEATGTWTFSTQVCWDEVNGY